MTEFHTPVLVEEVIKYLAIKPGEKYIDATLGGGGHTENIIKQGGKVLAIDHDPVALRASRRKLAAYPSSQLKLVKGNFKDIQLIAQKAHFLPVAGILFDLGPSTYQLTRVDRGFSFRENAQLDMRMDPDLKVTAKDLVNGLSKKELYELFTKLAQERHARAIAAAIVRARRQKPIATTRELARIVEQVYAAGNKYPNRKTKLHPATKAFLALRIAVNDELNNLKIALPQALKVLKAQGRLVVISFHQGEDRIVKHFFKTQAKLQRLEILSKKPITPSNQEIYANPNARSAKLRAAQINLFN